MSTLRLILTRHAKSSWDDPTVADHDRPLNARGIRSAGLIGGWLASRGDVPGEVLCSDALRTRETWDHIAPHLGGAPALTLKPALYHAGPDVMLAVLRHATQPVVMMLGHNPGIAEFAARLLAHAPADPEFQRYPTGATLVATFEEADWADVGFGSGAALDFVTPRNLE
jgi:phosphohistidine phosphatase